MKYSKLNKSLLPLQLLSFLCSGRNQMVTAAKAVAIAVVVVDVGG